MRDYGPAGIDFEVALTLSAGMYDVTPQNVISNGCNLETYDEAHTQEIVIGKDGEFKLGTPDYPVILERSGDDLAGSVPQVLDLTPADCIIDLNSTFAGRVTDNDTFDLTSDYDMSIQSGTQCHVFEFLLGATLPCHSKYTETYSKGS